jgi:predicted phage replisome organizer
MAEVKWIKITTDIFDDEKILMIETLPSADTILVIWFKLLALAGKSNNNGVFMMNNRIPYTEDMLAAIFRRDDKVVRFALNTFEQFGMIEIIDSVITIPNWDKHQSLDAYEKKKERDRKLQAERREKQRALIEKSSDNRLTSGDSSSDVAVSEEDKEKDKDNNKRIKKESSYDEILSSIANDDLRELYLEYIKMRKMIKAPMTDRALTMLISKVNDLEPHSIENQKKLLEIAIMNNWKSVYPLRNTEKSDNVQGKQLSTQTEELLKLFGG